MKWIHEIRKVGLKDWAWYVFVLKRGEYHTLNHWEDSATKKSKRFRAQRIKHKLLKCEDKY